MQHSFEPFRFYGCLIKCKGSKQGMSTKVLDELVFSISYFSDVLVFRWDISQEA